MKTTLTDRAVSETHANLLHRSLLRLEGGLAMTEIASPLPRDRP